MITLRRFTLDDYEELVDMHYSFVKEVFDHRKISPKYFFYKEVIHWINSSRDIILACRDETIVGYTMAYIDEFGGLTEAVYNAEAAYVKPEHRKSKAGYLLFNNAYNYAKEIGLRVITNGKIDNGVSDMMSKHFNIEPRAINYERITNEQGN